MNSCLLSLTLSQDIFFFLGILLTVTLGCFLCKGEELRSSNTRSSYFRYLIGLVDFRTILKRSVSLLKCCITKWMCPYVEKVQRRTSWMTHLFPLIKVRLMYPKARSISWYVDLHCIFKVKVRLILDIL